MSKYLERQETIRDLVVDELLENKEWLPHFHAVLTCFDECFVPISSPGGSLQRRICWFVTCILAGEPDEMNLDPVHREKIRDALTPFLNEGRKRLAERGIADLSH